MLRVMSGKNSSKLELEERVNLKIIKVYYIFGHKNLCISRLQTEISESMNKVINYLNQKCLNCEEIYLKDLELGFDIWMCAMTDRTAPTLEEQLTNLNGKIDPYIELIKSSFGISNYSFESILSCFDDWMTELSNREYFEKLFQIRNNLTQELHRILGFN